MKNMNHKSLSVSRLLTSIVLMLLISACSSLSSQSDDADITAEPTQSAATYAEYAARTEGAEHADWLILTLKASIVEEDYAQGQELVNTLAKLSLTDMQQAEWMLARAQVIAVNSDAESALKQLNFQERWQLANIQWANYHQMRATLFEDMNDFFNASRELIAYKDFQPQEAIEVNQNIWEDLKQYSASEIVQLKTYPSETELQGWLFVATKMKTEISDPMKLQQTLQQWFPNNISHPIVTDTPEDVQNILDLNVTNPQNVAVLLPLSGKYEKPATIIRDGFVHALTNDQEKDPNFKMTFYDTSTQSLEDIFAELKANGTDYIVGPLIKDEVADLQRIVNGEIPMLALNFPDNFNASSQVCYLTLSPEQEGAQAAKHLFEEGFKYPLVMAPKDKLGQRITEAFTDKWAELSQTPVATSGFGNRADLQKNVKEAFGLTDSQARINQIRQITNMSMETEARSRRDIDSVYIVATRQELTLIKPFIEVAINPGLKVPELFSSSRSNNGKQREYQDVSGIIYSDIPLVINKDDAAAQEYEEQWPNTSNNEKRLHALGMDSYMLLSQLPTMKVVHEYQVQGQTGRLSIDDQCVVQRELNWAEHENLQTETEEETE